MGGIKFLQQLKRKWRVLLALEGIIYAAGFSLFVFLSFNIQAIFALLIFFGVIILTILALRPWKIDLMRTARLVDRELDVAESSAVLLVEMEPNSSALYQLQQRKVGRLLQEFSGNINIPHHFQQAIVFSVIAGALGFLIQQTSTPETADLSNDSSPEVIFTPEDSTIEESVEARIQSLTLTLTPPKYTGLRTSQENDPNLEVLEGTIVEWKVEMSLPVESLSLRSGNRGKEFKKIGDNTFSGTWRVQHSGFYNFEFLHDKEKMVSDIYQIEVTKDATPKVEVLGLDQYTRFSYDDQKEVTFSALVSDDFGLDDVHIIATVAKGSGESVRFREERMDFINPLESGAVQGDLRKGINLDSMGLTPGDELYFYVQAIDNMEPEPNIARTSTYFLSIIDTTDIEFSLEGSLGVDLMPEYFRSQRQIIIETEQLIKDKPNLSEYDFNFKSNELGFDQKALRIRYGQFMGEEFESSMMNVDAGEGEHDDHDHDHDEHGEHEGEEDPLAAYTHNHDHENEHNLVEDEKEEDPLEQYKHIHDDPEETTFFSISIKQKLREALTVMWDAELYLRLYEPEKSLPHQYEALRLLKQIKNHARVYVHRIGFDPPPIKEESRLTGDLDEVNSRSRAERLENEDRYKNIKNSIARMAVLIESREALSASDKLVFENAGNELAGLAIETPGAYLNTLQQLKQLSFDNLPNSELSPILELAYRGLIQALPKPIRQPAVSDANMTQLKRAMLTEIDPKSNE